MCKVRVECGWRRSPREMTQLQGRVMGEGNSLGGLHMGGGNSWEGISVWKGRNSGREWMRMGGGFAGGSVMAKFLEGGREGMGGIYPRRVRRWEGKFFEGSDWVRPGDSREVGTGLGD